MLKYVNTEVNIPFINLHTTKKGMLISVSFKKSADWAITETPPKLIINAPIAHFTAIGDELFVNELTPHVISSIPEIKAFMSDVLIGTKFETKAEKTSVISSVSSIPPITENKTT